MINLKDLREIIKILDDGKIRYWIFGGVAVDGIRGRITRLHKDIDIFVLSTGCRKFLKALYSHKYKCYRQGNKYLAKKSHTIIEIVRLIRKEKMFIAYSNRKITCYPINIFKKYPQVHFRALTFHIAPNEVLVFKSKFSQNNADRKLCSRLKYNTSLEKRITFRRITKKSQLEKIIFK